MTETDTFRGMTVTGSPSVTVLRTPERVSTEIVKEDQYGATRPLTTINSQWWVPSVPLSNGSTDSVRSMSVSTTVEQ